ncbi:DDE-type integrase/transposase/recombinase [Lacticaseibacillus paracasei subsp. paracasei]|nr:DDE-type integrase/transposase/recombinase [Lacticaseibacillus paracasei subsp. paracasei]
MDTDLVLKTLESAVKNRTITGDLIIHTDLGSQYTSDDYNQRLTELHIRHSYSRKGCPCMIMRQWNPFTLPQKGMCLSSAGL